MRDFLRRLLSGTPKQALEPRDRDEAAARELLEASQARERQLSLRVLELERQHALIREAAEHQASLVSKQNQSERLALNAAWEAERAELEAERWTLAGYISPQLGSEHKASKRPTIPPDQFDSRLLSNAASIYRNQVRAVRQIWPDISEPIVLTELVEPGTNAAFEMGTGSQCAIRASVPWPEENKVHAIVVRRNGGWFLVPLSQGVVVENQFIQEEARLSDGTMFAIGSSAFRFEHGIGLLGRELPMPHGKDPLTGLWQYLPCCTGPLVEFENNESESGGVLFLFAARVLAKPREAPTDLPAILFERRFVDELSHACASIPLICFIDSFRNFVGLMKAPDLVSARRVFVHVRAAMTASGVSCVDVSAVVRAGRQGSLLEALNSLVSEVALGSGGIEVLDS